MLNPNIFLGGRVIGILAIIIIIGLIYMIAVVFIK